jgi:hypothetical protein
MAKDRNNFKLPDFADFCNESAGELNEDIASQTVENRRRLANVIERMNVTKERMSKLSERLQNYKERSAKTKDPISKKVYAAKTTSAQARQRSYLAYMKYLQEMQNYYQNKDRELQVRASASAERAR